MRIQYFNEYSPTMGRNMEIKVWGHAGKPVLFIPCQDGRFYDFENYRMVDVWAPWIEEGRCMVFSIDTADAASWSDKVSPAYDRVRRYEQWINFITREVVPFMRGMANECNGWTGYPGILVTGSSLGATHAVNLYLRFPDLFDGLLAMSGIYTADYGFDGYRDEVVYRNSPVDFLPNLPADHPFIQEYNRHKGIIVCGQGAWEVPETTFRLRDICAKKGIDIWFDIWGYDCKHDWDWWYKQVAYHIPHLL